MTVATDPGNEWGIEALDLPTYLARVGHHGPAEPSLRTLRQLHRAHLTRIGFENLDVWLLGRISLDLTDIQDKMVRRMRGGYCHEHNLLFAAALQRLGFRVMRLLARVRRDPSLVLPRGHATLLVDIDRQTWLADVGYGADGLLEPIRLAPDQTSRQGGWSYRILRDAQEWTLQTGRSGGWRDLYSFSPVVYRQPDFEMANHFVSTHPSSPFATQLIAQRATDSVRLSLADCELTRTRAGENPRRRRVNPEELPRVLRDTFGIVLSSEERERLGATVLAPGRPSRKTPQRLHR